MSCRRFRRLFPDDVYGTIACMKNDSVPLSPAFGLLMHANPALCGNIHSFCASLQQRGDDGNNAATRSLVVACSLSRESFQSCGSVTRPTATLSKAPPHCSPVVLGALMGSALRGSSDEEVTRLLKSHAIQTNKVDGRWTGVSLARYIKFYQTLAQGIHNRDAGTPDFVSPLFSRYVWERCEARLDLLHYLQAVHQLSPVLKTGFDPNAFLSAPHAPGRNKSFRLEDIEQSSRPGGAYNAEALEDAVFALAQTQSVRPCVKIRKHAFSPTAKQVSDCVEVTVREICEYVAEDSAVRRHKSGVMQDVAIDSVACSPALEELLADAARVNTPDDERLLASKWFGRCHEYQDCCEYLLRDEMPIGETAPTNKKFELGPGIKNAAIICSDLLLVNGSKRRGETSFDFLKAAGFTVTETFGLIRSLASEEPRRRETVVLKSPVLDKWIEVEYEYHYPTAKVVHRSPEQRDISRARPQMLDSWRQRIVSPNSHVGSRLASVWYLFDSIVLQDRMLRAMANEKTLSRVTETGSHDAVVALLSTPFRQEIWNPMENTCFFAEGLVADIKRDEKMRNQRCLDALRLCADSVHFRTGYVMQWIFRATVEEGLLQSADAVAVGRAIAEAPEPLKLKAAATLGPSVLLQLDWDTLRASPCNFIKIALLRLVHKYIF